MRVRECVLSSLRPSTCTTKPPTTHHPTPSRPKPALARGRLREEGQPPRVRRRGRGCGERERVARMRPDTRGGLPGAISRGRRCRRPKTLLARVVDARRIFRRTSFALGYTYLCPPHPPPHVPSLSRTPPPAPPSQSAARYLNAAGF